MRLRENLGFSRDPSAEGRADGGEYTPKRREGKGESGAKNMDILLSRSGKGGGAPRREPPGENPWAWGSRSDGKEIGFGVGSGFGAEMDDFVFVVGAQVVVAEAVGLGVADFFETGAQFDPLGGVDVAFEDGKLDPRSVILAGLCNAAEAALSGGSGGGDIVADEHEHSMVPYLGIQGG